MDRNKVPGLAFELQGAANKGLPITLIMIRYSHWWFVSAKRSDWTAWNVAWIASRKGVINQSCVPAGSNLTRPILVLSHPLNLTSTSVYKKNLAGTINQLQESFNQYMLRLLILDRWGGPELGFVTMTDIVSEHVGPSNASSRTRNKEELRPSKHDRGWRRIVRNFTPSSVPALNHVDAWCR